MSINRREFIILTAAVAAGCKADGDGPRPALLSERSVDAGPASGYAADGVYDRFRDQGFFVIRNGEKLTAISAVCTHRACKLSARPDHSFFCKCHGSTFDADGKVTKGPALRDLPVLPTSTNEKGELIVKILGT